MKFSWYGTEESVKKNVRQVTANEALKKINQETAELLFLDNTVKSLCVSYIDDKGYRKRCNVFITGWALHNLAYRIMLHSTDYRGEKLTDERDLALLLQSTVNHEHNEERKRLQELGVSDDNLETLYIGGLSGEQIQYQVLSKHLDVFAREMFIMFETVFDKAYISSIVNTVTGCTSEEVIKSLLIAWGMSLINPIIDPGKDGYLLDSIVPYDKYCDVISRYTTDYYSVRKNADGLGRQLLYTKPFVRTQRGEVISISVLLNMFLIDHCIYWIVRDYYKDNGMDFAGAFGEAFESYFKKLLQDTLNDNEYHKIGTSDTKSADWKLCVGEKVLLIEQKSALMAIGSRQQIPDIDAIKNYYSRHLLKAIKQLRQSELDCGNDCIKIILVYEDTFPVGLLTDYCKKQKIMADGGPYLILTIEDMEMLLSIYKSNSIDFHRIIEKIIGRKNTHISSIAETVLNEEGYLDNDYLEKECFLKYRRLYRDFYKPQEGQ